MLPAYFSNVIIICHHPHQLLNFVIKVVHFTHISNNFLFVQSRTHVQLLKLLLLDSIFSQFQSLQAICNVHLCQLDLHLFSGILSFHFLRETVLQDFAQRVHCGHLSLLHHEVKHSIFNEKTKFRHSFELFFAEMVHLGLHQFKLFRCVEITLLVIKRLQLE